MRPLATTLGFLMLAGSVQSQHIHRNPFEGRETAWRKGPTDAAYREQVHDMSTAEAHTGQQSEHVQLQVDRGTYVHYLYPIGRADLEELNISAWVKANRPGVQLLARIVLPQERDPANLDVPLTTLIRSTEYRLQGRWQRLDFRRPRELARQQQQLMQAEMKRDVNFDGAFVDQILINVCGGPGLNEVWIDDLEAGPLPDRSIMDLIYRKTSTTPGEPAKGLASNLGAIDRAPAAAATRHAVIELNQDRLQINKRPFFIRGIRHSDTPLKTLRDAGFNTIWIDHNAPSEAFEEALNLGFWLIPTLPVLDGSPRMAAAGGLAQEVSRFAYSDGVVLWDIGHGLTMEQSEPVSVAAKTVQNADPYKGRPVSADIWDGFQPYGRNLDMIGVHRWPLMTGLELTQYQQWLKQRRNLSRRGTFMWTWIQTHLPDWYTQLVYDQTAMAEFNEPIGPQPEQIRLLTYVALSAGYRGLGFWSDRYLANSHQGRDRLLMLAILNQELEMLEPMLATVKESYWINTKNPEVKAAVLRYEGGVLVLPIWLGRGAQMVPGQMAANNLEITVPQVPADAQVWEISPGGMWSPRRERVAGGVKVTLPEFGLTSALVFTSDIATIARMQQHVRKSQRLAAQWSYDLAVEELQKVEKINQQLEHMGQGVPESHRLISDARQKLDAARRHWLKDTSPDYGIAYAETQRAVRPLRVLMRASWEQAVKSVENAVASPYAASYFTLPRHWQFVNQIQSAQPGANVLAIGNFDAAPGPGQQDWTAQQVTVDSVELSAKRVAEQPKDGNQCLKLEIKPLDAKVTPEALERTYLALNSPEFSLPPGSLVRISGWMRVPEAIRASADGVLLFDSIAGEPLGIRQTEATPWKKFTLYREVPDSGVVSVSLALTGIGTAYFDDIRIEPLTGGAPRPLARSGGTAP